MFKTSSTKPSRKIKRKNARSGPRINCGGKGRHHILEEAKLPILTIQEEVVSKIVFYDSFSYILWDYKLPEVV